MLGLGAAAIFFRVTLPLAWRGILAGVLLAFARALGEFGATLMVAGSIPGKTQTLSIAVYEAVQAGQDELANFLVLLTSVTCVVVLLPAGRLGRAAHAGARMTTAAPRWEVAIRKSLRERRPSLRARRRASPARRERLVLFGPSGAGKSLTLKAIAGLMRPDAGRIAFDGRALFDAAARHRRAGPRAPPRLRVPGVRAVPAPDRAAEHRLRR